VSDREKTGSNDLPSWEAELYRRHVERLENLPQNRDGADKSWVHRAEEEIREHYRKAKIVR
jgi:hypothetical protein